MSTSTDLDKKILHQVEFYFSDSNFPKDKFLRAQASQNEEGYVPIATVATFKRMKELTPDVKKITEIMRSSSELDVSSDGLMVKRKNPLPELDTSLDRTIYAKGFPSSDGVTIDEIAEVFKPYGKVLSVRIRKTLEKKSKDSAFIEFSSAEEAKAASTAKPPAKYKNTELTKVMMKQDYTNMKKEERKQAEKEKKDSKRKAEEPADDTTKESKKARKGPKDGKQEKDEKKEEEEDKIIPGVIIQFKNIGEGVTREILKETFGKYGKVAFADFSQNQLQGYMRFDQADDAKKALQSMIEAKVEIGGKVPELKLLEGEEEKTYWTKVKQARDDKKKKAKGGRKGYKGKRKRY